MFKITKNAEDQYTMTIKWYDGTDIIQNKIPQRETVDLYNHYYTPACMASIRGRRLSRGEMIHTDYLLEHRVTRLCFLLTAKIAMIWDDHIAIETLNRNELRCGTDILTYITYAHKGDAFEDIDLLEAEQEYLAALNTETPAFTSRKKMQEDTITTLNSARIFLDAVFKYVSSDTAVEALGNTIWIGNTAFSGAAMCDDVIQLVSFIKTANQDRHYSEWILSDATYRSRRNLQFLYRHVAPSTQLHSLVSDFTSTATPQTAMVWLLSMLERLA